MLAFLTLESAEESLRSEVTETGQPPCLCSAEVALGWHRCSCFAASTTEFFGLCFSPVPGPWAALSARPPSVLRTCVEFGGSGEEEPGARGGKRLRRKAGKSRQLSCHILGAGRLTTTPQDSAGTPSFPSPGCFGEARVARGPRRQGQPAGAGTRGCTVYMRGRGAFLHAPLFWLQPVCMRM